MLRRPRAELTSLVQRSVRLLTGLVGEPEHVKMASFRLQASSLGKHWPFSMILSMLSPRIVFRGKSVASSSASDGGTRPSERVTFLAERRKIRNERGRMTWWI